MNVVIRGSLPSGPIIFDFGFELFGVPGFFSGFLPFTILLTFASYFLRLCIKFHSSFVTTASFLLTFLFGVWSSANKSSTSYISTSSSSTWRPSFPTCTIFLEAFIALSIHSCAYSAPFFSISSSSSIIS